MHGKPLTVPFVLAVTVTVAVLSSIGIHLQNSIAAETLGARRRPSRAHLAWHSIYDDERERVRMFNEDLRDRCVVASSGSPEGSGTWIVDCTSRQRLRLVYDRDGNLARVTDQMRLTLWSLPEDEPERQRIFNRELRGYCQVTSSRMESPGTWVAECSSGARFRLVFREGYCAGWSGIPVAALEARRP